MAQWFLILSALIYSLLFSYFSWGGAAAYVLAALPILLAYLVSRSWLAAAFMALLPMYFVIGQITAGWHHFTPYVALDHAMPLAPRWILVYASLYLCAFVLPLVVVRSRQLFHQALKAYLFVMIVSYAGFVIYPTIAPRNDALPVHDFASWGLRLFYDLDQPYGCFPSLHVAYSFVAALTCWRVHRGLGIAACVWASLIGVSTVYTKQHYVIDVPAGALAAVVAYLLFLRNLPGAGVADRDHQLAPRRARYVVAAYGAMIAVFTIAYTLGLGPVSR